MTGSNQKNKRKEKTVRSFNTFNRKLGIILGVTAFVLYLNTLHHDYVLDDFSVIKDNPVTTLGIKALPDIFGHFYRYGYSVADDGIYRPLPVAMFAIEWSLAPGNSSLGHFINLLLFAFTGYILFITLTRLLKNYSVLLPFTITLLFIAHPVHTEVVANIKSLDELLCFLLSFASLYYLLDYIEGRSWKKLVIAAVFFFGAFLSKETAVTMILVFPLALYFFTDAKKQSLIVATLALVAVAGVFFLLRAVILSDGSTYKITVLENPLLAAPDMMHRLATAIKILGDYLLLLLFPYDLLSDRSFNQIPVVGFSNVSVLLSFLIYTAMLLYAMRGFPRKNLFAFGILFYLVTISIFSNIVFTIGVAMADRFLYFASFGFCFVLALALIKITRTSLAPAHFSGWPDFFQKYKTVLLITMGIGILYSTRTISRNADWKNNYTLFSHDLEKAPENARIHAFLGNEIIRTKAPAQQDPAQRLALYMKGIQELKTSLNIYPDHADAWNNIGLGYMQIDSMDLAEFYFKKAMAFNPGDFTKLGDLYFAKKDYGKAIDYYKKTLALNPRHIDAAINLGICYGTLKQYGESIPYFLKALELRPKDAQICYFLATAYKFNGDRGNYEKYAQKASELDPEMEKP